MKFKQLQKLLFLVLCKIGLNLINKRSTTIDTPVSVKWFVPAPITERFAGQLGL